MTRGMEPQVSHRAMAIPATARSPAATEPTFFVAAPVKLSPDPVFDGATGVIGEPEATPDPEPEPEAEPDPEPEPELEPEPTAPVTKGPDAPVPVAYPVAPTTALVLWMSQSKSYTGQRIGVSYTIAVVFVHEHSLSKYVDVDVYTIG